MFYFHLATIPEDSLAGEFFSIQNRDINYKSIVTECNELLSKWNVNNVTAYTKKQWGRFMKDKIHSRNKEELILQGKEYKKINIEDYKTQPFVIKPYLNKLNLRDSRVIFRRNCQLLQSVQLNFKK